jgi:DNA-binding NarL/FixJ family response regulator
MRGRRNVKVLLVDDNPDARFLLKRRLGNRRSFTVIGEASDGAQALAMVEELKPDLVIMDVRMPGMDGIEATRRIKEAFPAVSVLALSASKESQTADAMRAAGAVGYVLKDAPEEELIMRLNDSLAAQAAAAG